MNSPSVAASNAHRNKFSKGAIFCYDLFGFADAVELQGVSKGKPCKTKSIYDCDMCFICALGRTNSTAICNVFPFIV